MADLRSPSVLLGLALAVLACGALWLRSGSERKEPSPTPHARPAECASSSGTSPESSVLAAEVPAAGREAIPPAPAAPASRTRVRPGETFPWYGRVVDADSGLPLEKATLQVEPPPDAPRSARALPAFVSGPDGRFPELHPRAGGPVPTLRHPGHASVRVPLLPGHGSRDAEYLIRLPRGASLALQLLEESGTGRAGCSVLVRAESEGLTWTGVTDAAGWSELVGIPPGQPLTLGWLEPGPSGGERHVRSWPGELVLAPLERRILTWKLGSGGLVAGTVQDRAGRPLEGLEVWLGSEVRTAGSFAWGEREVMEGTALTDTEGRFRFDDLLPATWWVGLAPGGEGLACLPARVELTEAVSEANVVLVVHRGLTIRGRVLLPNGQPRQGCALTAACDQAPFTSSAGSGAEGCFVLGPLVAGDYRIEARPADHHRFAASPVPVLARAGDEDVVVLLEVGGVVSGRVVDGPTGRPVRAVVDLLPSSLRGTEGAQRAVTGKNGRFEFRHVLAGGYELTARTGRKAIATLSGLIVERGNEVKGIELAAESAARVTFHLAGETDGLVQVWREGLPVLQEPIPAGRPHPCALPAGEVVLMLFRDSRDPPVRYQQLALTLGELEEREIELGPLPAPPGDARSPVPVQRRPPSRKKGR